MEKDSVKYIKYLADLVLLLIGLGIIFIVLAAVVFFSPWTAKILERAMAYDFRFFIELAVFATVAVIILGLSVLTVYSRNIVHAALYLIGSFAGVAALYVLLNATFIGVAQVLVYIGAIGVLILFAVMLTRKTLTEESND
ncbi:MAG: F(420)H(2) dehydrogenase subunit J [Methanosaeta sp. PtaB.Bin039]|nr:MAG: F(420)H(2) dehydrogenase subunit J [Methanosaeta sp. PtaB.Bin039]OPY45218.1 MAG: F(420)H(2) dehydrogenase subunit J [Methanosaeta sp. PtaU1.Bin028]HQF16614.1 NADH-quinone oxidoreductase subunit J [Methanotrichaceae archaeon]HQI91246.1 NADH-quinone oxidoreductase subunit J [Methanotrichaceae archaeon]HQJ61706.1 NADH-quinone oxidoreductase subunit J [Methanothrix soehngenii]